MRDSEHGSVVVDKYTCGLSDGPAQKSRKFSFMKFKYLKLIKKMWTACTTSVLYDCNPGSSSWECSDSGFILPIDGPMVCSDIGSVLPIDGRGVCSDIGFILPIDGGIIEFSIVLYCN